MACPSSKAWMLAASASVIDRTPWVGIQWYFTSTESPCSFTHRYVLTPNPCMWR